MYIWYTYNSDNIVRRATSLQKTSDAKNKDFLFISEEYAKKNYLSNYDKVKLWENKKEYQLSVLVKENMEKNAFAAYLGTKAGSVIEGLEDKINLERIK